MGTLTGIRKEDIETFLSKRSLGGTDSFVVARRHNGFAKGLLKLLSSNLYYAMDATTIRIIAATEDFLIVINPSWRVSGNLETLPDDRIQKIPWGQVQDFSIATNLRVATISWGYNGKRQVWTVDIGNPGVWHFNPKHIQKLQSYTSEGD